MIKTQSTKIAFASLLLAASAFTASALPTSYYTQSSVLSTGRWVKVEVAEEGIHEITYQQLSDWGFDDPASVTVYGYGGSLFADSGFWPELPDDLCQQTIYNSSRFEKICFYGVPDYSARVMTNSSIKIERNVYSTKGYYFITDSKTYQPPVSIPFESTGRQELTNHTHMEYVENDVINPSSGGAFFFDRSFVDDPQTFSFPVRDFYNGNASFTGTLLYQYASDVAKTLTVIPKFENDMFTDIGGIYQKVDNKSGDSSCRFTLSNVTSLDLSYDSTQKAGTCDVTFAIPETFSGNLTYASMNFVALLYCRNNSMALLPQLDMYFPGANTSGKTHNVKVTSANAFTQIWEIVNPYTVRPMSTSYNSNTGVAIGSLDASVSYSASRGAAHVIAFSPSYSLKSVAYVGEVASQNLHGEDVPDMVILTTPSLRPQAERLAAIHNRHQGMDVKVVTQEEIFNEFSSGTPHAMGVRRYAKMLYDRNPDKFRHLLLFGLGTWDNRNIVIPATETLITYQAEEPGDASIGSRCFANDGYFGMLGDAIYKDNLRMCEMNVNVGRMPINNLSDATITVDKIEDYFLNPPVHGSYNRALLFCDDGDGGDHLNQSDAVYDIISDLSPGTTVTKVYNALYPWTNHDAVTLRDALQYYLAQGQGYMGYAGHGRSDRLGAHEKLWDISLIDNTDYPISPFTMLSTCNTFIFDRVASDITGHMIRKPNGGAINIIAACRAVFKNLNQDFNKEVSKEYFSARPGDVVGDIFRRARNNACIETTENLAVNTMCYNLAGDPAIPLFVPSLKVATLSIDGVATGSEAIDVYPLKPFVIKGQIVDDEGNVQTGYNGVVTIDLYDGARDIMSSSKGETSSEHTKLVHIDETILTTVAANVVDGCFEATLTSPSPVYPAESNRISYYATNDDYTVFASGMSPAIKVNPYDESKLDVVDTEAPVITAIYLNDPAFSNGDEVDNSPMVYVNIAADASGLNVSGGNVGNGARLRLDNSQSFNSAAASLKIMPDGGATMAYGLNNLTEGFHSLEFSIADNAGNRSSSTVSFYVVNTRPEATLAVNESPARTEATFIVAHTFEGNPTGRLVVEDIAGNTVYSKENCSFPFTWDLRDLSGNPVADGHYNAYAILNSGIQYGNTPKTSLVVIK